MIKRLFCKHEYKFFRNIYGDEIIYISLNRNGVKRSIWICNKCGKELLKDELYKEFNHNTQKVSDSEGYQ